MPLIYYQHRFFDYQIADLSGLSKDTIPNELNKITKFNGVRISNRSKFLEKQIELRSQIESQQVDSELMKQAVRRTQIASGDYYDELKSNGLQEFPMEILKIDSIKYLDLSYNGITLVPEEIIKLKNLERLDISHNKIQFIEQIEWDKLPNLIMINLSGNVGLDIPDKLIRVIKKNNGESKRQALILQRDLAVRRGEYEEAAKFRDIQDGFGIIR